MNEKNEKEGILIMDNLVLISKKNIAKDDFDCELQNENVDCWQERFLSLNADCVCFFWK